MKKLISLVFIILIITGFIDGANYPSPFSSRENEMGSVTSLLVEEKEINSIKVCDKENATLLEKLTCADDVKSSYLRSIIKELIVRQENLIKELDETKEKLETTQKQLQELKEIRNNSTISLESSSLTPINYENSSSDSLVNENKTEKSEKGILEFFKKIFNRNKRD